MITRYIKSLMLIVLLILFILFYWSKKLKTQLLRFHNKRRGSNWRYYLRWEEGEDLLM